MASARDQGTLDKQCALVKLRNKAFPNAGWIIESVDGSSGSMLTYPDLARDRELTMSHTEETAVIPSGRA